MTAPRNRTDNKSFFASEFNSPSGNDLIYDQVDPTSPQTVGLARVSDPVAPTQNAQSYVTNFDPELYNLSDSSHLMRLIRAMVGSSGLDGVRRQMLIARLTSMLQQGAFVDLDKFYGAIFGLQRHTYELMPENTDGTTVNPYTDLAPSDVWDQAIAADARYRARLHQLAQAINMGATYYGMKIAAEAVVSCEVDIVESWAKVDYYNDQDNLPTPTVFTYNLINTELGTYGAVTPKTYGDLQGQIFGGGQLPVGNRGELIFTPRDVITTEEQYQLQEVLNKIKPAGTMITISSATVSTRSKIVPRHLYSDSEDWQIQSRVTPAVGLVNPPTPVYQNADAYSLARPVFSEYSGEQWSYNGVLVRADSYRIDIYGNQVSDNDDEKVTYLDGTRHNYVASDGVKDVRQAIATRVSGEGSVTTMPFAESRGS